MRETIPAGPNAKRQAEKALTRLQNQVDEKRAPRTSATLDQLLDRYLDVGVDVDPNTRGDYISKANKHIRPFLGSVAVARIEADTLESLYADLRRCKDRCQGRQYVQHRSVHEHVCDEHGVRGPCEPLDPNCRKCKRMCKPHQCRPYNASGVRAVHYILSGAFAAAVRWGWLAVNPAQGAKRPSLPTARPQPPSAEDAARLVNEAFKRGVGWGTFIWTAMTTGARRGELCGLRWKDLDLAGRVMHIQRAIARDEKGRWMEKDTKTHQQRRVVLDEETTALLAEHRARAMAEAEGLRTTLDGSGYMFSSAPDHSRFAHPGAATQRYERMSRSLGIDSTLHKLRHYSATELLNAGVNIRAVAGRLGHGGGGATTLRVYTAWLAEADQRAAPAPAGRMPERPATAIDGTSAPVGDRGDQDQAVASGPYVQIARDLRGAIRCGAFRVGDLLPPIKELARRYSVAESTAHRAIAQLAGEGAIRVSRGRRPIVIDAGGGGTQSPGVLQH